MEVIRRRPNSIPGPKERFTGSVSIDLVAMPGEPSRLRAFSVHFHPGARTAWHSHPLGQVLVVTDGAGRIQRRGGEVEEISVGDVVMAPPGEWHWHGAGPESFMTHLALSESGPDGSEAEWDAHVSDTEYLTAPDERRESSSP